jgi:SAM-dependent methyltransferase
LGIREIELVRDGYDKVAPAYLETRKAHSPDIELLQRLAERLRPRAAILDAGCGAGVPVTSQLAKHFNVTGVDISIAQLRLARDLVPSAELVCQDLSALGFADSSFDAICSYYAVIHVPRSLHAHILAEFHRLLAPGGLALLCLGANDLEEEVEEDYFGVEMYWSHYDEETNRRLLNNVGLEEIWAELVPDAAFGEGEHLFVLARMGYA